MVTKFKIIVLFFIIGFIKNTHAQSCGLALKNTELTEKNDGSYDASFDIVCSNFSFDTLKNMQVVFKFSDFFASSSVIKPLFLYSAAPTNNPILTNNDFGNTPQDSTILKGTQNYLLPNTTITLGFKFNLKLNGAPDSIYYVRCKISGNININKIIDYSTDGELPDPNNDDICNENNTTELHLSFTDIVVPNVFTPNNDGVNELFTIQNISKYHNYLQVMNRWGKIVYQQLNYNNDWDGAFMPEGLRYENDVEYLSNGTYYYILKYGYQGTDLKTKYGVVTIFK